MSTLGRWALLSLAMLGLWAVLFQFAYTVYGALEAIPMDIIWGTLFVLLVVMWVYYAKWLAGYWRKDKVRREEQAPLKVWPRKQVIAVLSSAPGSMERMEHSVQGWTQRGDTPGSLAGSVIGLEAIDEYLEGDM